MSARVFFYNRFDNCTFELVNWRLRKNPRGFLTDLSRQLRRPGMSARVCFNLQDIWDNCSFELVNWRVGKNPRVFLADSRGNYVVRGWVRGFFKKYKRFNNCSFELFNWRVTQRVGPRVKEYPCMKFGQATTNYISIWNSKQEHFEHVLATARSPKRCRWHTATTKCNDTVQAPLGELFLGNFRRIGVGS